MPFCPNCGKEAPEEATFCERCGEKIPDLKTSGVGLEWTPPRRGLVNHLRVALGLLKENPIIFVPEVVGAFVSMALTRLWGLVGQPTGMRDLWDEYLGRDWNVMNVAYGPPDVPPDLGLTIPVYVRWSTLHLSP